jgi:hypothetical protein
MREPDAHAGGPTIHHFLEYSLVFGDGAVFSRLVEPRIYDRPPRFSH